MNELRPGTILRGKYRVERVIGMGGMGVVVRATHLRLSQLVAIKALRPEARNRTTSIKRRFAREARAASRLRGEHAVRILDVDDSESGEPFLVMEHLEGQDLKQVLYAEGALSITRAVDYILQACEAIAEAHSVGIIHRDLKPANLFLTTRPDGSPLIKILDFGISKTSNVVVHGNHEEDDDVTKPGGAVGTPSYMSPEQLKNACVVDARADVWGLGVVLYELLSDALPFDEASGAALLARIAADPPRPLREHRPDVPEELAAVVDRCLSKDRNDRYADVAELAQALAAFGSAGRGSGADRAARVAGATLRSQHAHNVISRDSDGSMECDSFEFSHTSIAETTSMPHTFERVLPPRQVGANVNVNASAMHTHQQTTTSATKWRTWVVMAAGFAERLARRIT